MLSRSPSGDAAEAEELGMEGIPEFEVVIEELSGATARISRTKISHHEVYPVSAVETITSFPDPFRDSVSLRSAKISSQFD
jgi:hypothetical protein